MTNKLKYSAEDIVSLIISNTASQYSEEWKPDIVHTKEELIKIVQSYANQEVKKACKELREVEDKLHFMIDNGLGWKDMENAPSPQD